MEKQNRNYSLDIVRIFAFLSVVGVHFFLNSGFYSQPMFGRRMLVMCIVRTFFMVCVPLFVMLTGYLMSGKVWSGKYYLGIVKALGIYVLASIVCILYKNAALHYNISAGRALLSLLDFTGANYAWYIEMYIGLFLLAPFINSMYHGLGTKKAKLALVVTLVFLTALPSVVNIYNFEIPGWWAEPYLSTEYQKLMPEWWTMLYPVTYYCLGAYIKEYPLKMKKWLNLLLWLLVTVAFGAFNFYRSRYGFFSWGKYTDWFSLPVTVLTLLAFTFLSGINTQNLPKAAKSTLKYLSEITLGAYLLSFVADNMVYSRLNSHVPEMIYRLEWFIPATLTVSLASLAGSAFINELWKLLTWLFSFALGGVKKLCPKRNNA